MLLSSCVRTIDNTVSKSALLSMSGLFVLQVLLHYLSCLVLLTGNMYCYSSELQCLFSILHIDVLTLLILFESGYNFFLI